MKAPIFLAAFLLAASFLRAAPSGQIEFQGCYARWSAVGLSVGNTEFEQSWSVSSNGLEAATFTAKNPRQVWMTATSPDKSDGKVPSLDVVASTGRRRIVEVESLSLEVAVPGREDARWLLQIFPKTAGTLVTPHTTVRDAAKALAGDAGSNGIEKDRGSTSAKVATRDLGVGGVALAPEHVRLTQVTLTDQTDEHDELVAEREWLLSVKEKLLQLPGNVLITEDVLTGCGLVFVKLAPLPHARPEATAFDYAVDPHTRSVRPVSDGYPSVVLAYAGGRLGRVEALQKFQRALRVYRAGRDGMLLSNTWGDRSRDARINEAFIMEEIAAGAKLGVDVIQIDDGWQKGRTANSSDNAKAGVWNGYWAADPEFWEPDPKRFPHGLAPVIAAARAQGMGFGLWYGPDSTNEAANWQRDADQILRMHHEWGVNYTKVDSLKTPTRAALDNQRRLFDRIGEASKGDVVIDLDVTAEIRPGYFGLTDVGPLFVENRYTDWRGYWPHHTLRNLWQLAHYVDPLRLRFEFLNPERNQDKYGGDPLAPATYGPDTLFAITMMANPLCFCEVSNLSPAFVSQVAPLIARWKQERAAMHGGTILPIGDVPDGVAWTGFVSRTADARSIYALLFRELNPSDSFTLELPGRGGEGATVTLLGGRGSATLDRGRLRAVIPAARDFVWVRIDGAGNGPTSR